MQNTNERKNEMKTQTQSGRWNKSDILAHCVRIAVSLLGKKDSVLFDNREAIAILTSDAKKNPSIHWDSCASDAQKSRGAIGFALRGIVFQKSEQARMLQLAGLATIREREINASSMRNSVVGIKIVDRATFALFAKDISK